MKNSANLVIFCALRGNLLNVLTVLRQLAAGMIDLLQTYRENVSMNETPMCAQNAAERPP